MQILHVTISQEYDSNEYDLKTVSPAEEIYQHLESIEEEGYDNPTEIEYEDNSITYRFWDDSIKFTLENSPQTLLSYFA